MTDETQKPDDTKPIDVPALRDDALADILRSQGVERKSKDNPDLPVITVTAGELHSIASLGEDALVERETPFYVRGGALVRPVTDDLPASHGRRTKVARLAHVTEASLVDHLSRSAIWMKWDARARKLVPTDPTSKIAAIIASRDGEWKFRKLSGVITTPTLRPDGTVLKDAGYDAATRLLLMDPPELPANMPERPDKKVALASLEFLDRLLAEFPFVDDASRSVALSALITPVVRGALSVAPMHATTAPVPGSGKSYIIDLASAINSGERAPVMTAATKEEETEKRLVASLLSGQTIISIDNVNGQLGGDFLCQVIERPVVSVRELGTSKTTKVESRATCYATGNNIQMVGDMTRRVIMCSLDPGVERPELRTFEKSPFDMVMANRGTYVAAALTVVRAYVVADYPGLLPPLASFEDWSRLVRSALVWLGRTDPCETMAKARADDPIMADLNNILTTWNDAVYGGPKKCSEIVEIANAPNGNGFLKPDFHAALMDVAGDGKNIINPRRLGKYLKQNEGRIVGGLKFVDAGDKSGQKTWKVVKAS